MKYSATLIIAALVCSTAAAGPEQVTCDSPCDCHDAHGEGRWSVKTDASFPPTDASAIQAVTPSDMFTWPGPDAAITESASSQDYCAQYLPPYQYVRRSQSLRPRQSFQCRSILPCGLIGRWEHCRLSLSTYWWQACIARPYSAQTSHLRHPHNHLITGPHRRVSGSGIGRANRAGGCPTVGAGIVSAASFEKVKIVVSAPHDHVTASPDGGCVTVDGQVH
jgi:hypothetical protein